MNINKRQFQKTEKKISSAQSEKVTVTVQKEDSYVKKSYLVAKAEDGTLYVKNMLPDTEVSEEKIVETAEKFLKTEKISGSYGIISLKFLFMKGNCSLPLQISHL